MNTSDSQHIRLLHLIKKLDIGGLERSTVEYSNRLASRLGWIGIFASEGIFNRGTLINPTVCFIPSHFPPERVLSFPTTALQIIQTIRRYHINVVHYHHRIFFPYLVLIRLFFPHIRIVYTHHNAFNDRITKLLPADAVICPSVAAADDFRKQNSRPVIIIHHGIELREPQPRHAAESLKYIGYIGRIEKEKGVTTLIEAFTALHRIDPAYRLVLRGSGSQRPELERKVAENRIESVVRFEGPFIDLDRLYEGIDLIVLPSVALEGFGLTIVEAIARGIPVVATTLEAFRDIIRNGVDGLLVPPGDAVALRTAIERMFIDESFRTASIAEARKRIGTLFGMDRAVHNYEDCLLSLFPPSR